MKRYRITVLWTDIDDDSTVARNDHYVSKKQLNNDYSWDDLVSEKIDTLENTRESILEGYDDDDGKESQSDDEDS
jgi:hypothetical protein